MPLADHDLEARVLGAALTSSEGHDAVAALADPCWDAPAHRSVARALRALHAEGKPADVGLVHARLHADSVLQAVGGLAYLSRLTDTAELTAHVEQSAAMLRDYAARRRLVAFAERVAARAERMGAADLAKDANRELAEIEAGEVTSEHRVGEVLEAMMLHLAESAERRGPSLRTGFRTLDDLLLPMRAGQLVIVGARPSCGKTSLALAIAQRAAEDGETVLFLSLETHRIDLATRLAASNAALNLSDILGHRLTAEQWGVLGERTVHVSKLPIVIDDDYRKDVASLRLQARALKRRQGLSLIVIDYLQLLEGAGDGEYARVSAVSRGLKSLAKELEVPILALSQLSRDSDKNDREPRLSDLRSSGQIEQDADAVLLMHRPREGSGDRVEVTVAKQKNGPLGRCLLRFHGPTTTFSDESDHDDARGYAARIGAAPPRAIQPHYAEPEYAYEDGEQTWHYES